MSSAKARLVRLSIVAAVVAAGAMLLFAACKPKARVHPGVGKVVEKGGEFVLVPERQAPRPTGETWVFVDKLDYKLGEAIPVEYKIKEGTAAQPWIGLVPFNTKGDDALTNDKAKVAGVTIDPAQLSGKTELIVPKIGEFEVRLFGGMGEGDKYLSRSETIGVTHWPQGSVEGDRLPILTIEGDNPAQPLEYSAGDTLTVSYRIDSAYPKTAWIGVIPTSVKSGFESDNDAGDVAYQYLEPGQTSGSVQFKLDKPGEYVIRMFPCNVGEAVAVFQTRKFTVK